MKRRDMLLATGAAAVGLSAFPLRWIQAADKRKQHLLFFTRSAGFEHSVVRRDEGALSHAERIMLELGKKHGFDVTPTKDGRVFDSDLDMFDAIFFVTTGDLTNAESRDGSEPMSPRGKQRLLEAIAAGKGFLGAHCAADTFHSEGPARERQENPDPYIAMLGGEFISHGPQQSATQLITSPDFPGVSSLPQPFKLHDEWYALKNFADNLHVILVQSTDGMNGRDYARPDFPSTWARLHGQGRVFYTSMGHREDVWSNDLYQGLLLGALSWAMRNVDADVTPNIDAVTPEAHVLEA